jgi:hypothetical protein
VFAVGEQPCKRELGDGGALALPKAATPAISMVTSDPCSRRYSSRDWPARAAWASLARGARCACAEGRTSRHELHSWLEVAEAAADAGDS